MQIINDYKVTTMHFVPSMLAAFMASIENSHEQGERVARSLQRVFCSGEALADPLIILPTHRYALGADIPPLPSDIGTLVFGTSDDNVLPYQA